MPHLIWAPQAFSEIQKAYPFLAEFDGDLAQAGAKTIKQKALVLEQFPQAGRPADGLDPEHNELMIPFRRVRVCAGLGGFAGLCYDTCGEASERDRV